VGSFLTNLMRFPQQVRPARTIFPMKFHSREFRFAPARESKSGNGWKPRPLTVRAERRSRCGIFAGLTPGTHLKTCDPAGPFFEGDQVKSST
jgi:hypothetical protein